MTTENMLEKFDRKEYMKKYMSNYNKSDKFKKYQKEYYKNKKIKTNVFPITDIFDDKTCANL